MVEKDPDEDSSASRVGGVGVLFCGHGVGAVLFDRLSTALPSETDSLGGAQLAWRQR
ncbi:MAG: hypothetical protein QOK44_2122 [Betaproteobacteria bacterium]|nr:hypothetical protein [Betaproteobacteria bacterium]